MDQACNTNLNYKGKTANFAINGMDPSTILGTTVIIVLIEIS